MYKKANGIWHVNIRVNGKRIQRSLGHNKRLAERLEAKLKTEIIEGKFFERSKAKTKTLSELFERFIAEHGAKVAEFTKVSYETSKKNMLKYFGENMTLLEITTERITEYKQHRYGQGRTAATINREIAALSKAFKLAKNEWGWGVAVNPCSAIGREPENNQRERWLSIDEEKALLPKCPEWLFEIVLFALNTGTRRGEILALELSDVDLFRKTAIIRETKNKTTRTIPLNETVIELLKRKTKIRKLGVPYVFPSSVGTRLCKRNLGRAFSIALEKAAVDGFRFHDLRHTAATRMVQHGVELYKVSKILGHKDISTTQRYAHHSPESLRDGVDVLSGFCLASAERGEGRATS